VSELQSTESSRREILHGVRHQTRRLIRLPHVVG
jgi:hypothetical protein